MWEGGILLCQVTILIIFGFSVAIAIQSYRVSKKRKAIIDELKKG